MNFLPLPDAVPMRPLQPPEAIEPQQHEALRAALAPDIAERLSHLFRASLKDGRIHPLYLPMLRYRSTQGER